MLINWSRIEALKEDVGREDVKEVIDLFINEIQQVIDKIPAQMEAENIADDLHFLKGSALSLGFQELSCVCQTGYEAFSKTPRGAFEIDNVRACFETSKAEFDAKLDGALA